MQKAVLVNSTIDTPRLRQRTDSGWFSRLLVARKRSGSFLSTTGPLRAQTQYKKPKRRVLRVSQVMMTVIVTLCRRDA